MSETALPDKGWTIYYNHEGLGVVGESVTGNVSLEHINGGLMKMIPLEGFNLEPGASVEIAYRNPGSLIVKTEAPQHPYMVYGDAEAGEEETVAKVDYSILPFPSLEKFHHSDLGIKVPDAAWVYEQNSVTSLMEPKEVGFILPSPVRETYFNETINLSKDVVIYYQEGLDKEAKHLSALMEQVTGFSPKVQ